MFLPSAYPFMVKQNGGVSWVNDPRSHRMSSLKISLWIMSTFVKWKFHELIFWTAHFQQLWAHGILSSLFLVEWVPGHMYHCTCAGQNGPQWTWFKLNQPSGCWVLASPTLGGWLLHPWAHRCFPDGQMTIALHIYRPIRFKWTRFGVIWSSGLWVTVFARFKECLLRPWAHPCGLERQMTMAFHIYMSTVMIAASSLKMGDVIMRCAWYILFARNVCL